MITDDKPISLTEQEESAIKAISRTHDGALLHRYLRRVLEAVFDLESDGALRVHTGRRTLARDLMRLMAEGIDDRSDRTADAPILSRPGGPAAVAPRRGAGRRITADTHVPGYDRPDRG